MDTIDMEAVAMSEAVRAQITVKGKVQKVQFRNFAKETAKKHHLVGTARNLSNYDEDVAIICEGPRRTIERYVQALKETARPPIKIDAIRVKYTKATGGFEDFAFKRSSDVTSALGERLDCLIEYMKLIDQRLEELNSKVDQISLHAIGEHESRKTARSTKSDISSRS